MKRCLRALAAASLAGLFNCVLVAQQPAQRSFSSYFFFGDSLTDNGNLFAAAGTPPAPYFQGRFSNGPTYAEYLRPGLAAHVTAPGSVRTNLNFAFGGATAGGTATLPPAIAVQLGLYQSRGITAGGNDLFVILAGANDLLNAVGVPANQNGPAMTAVGAAAAQAVATHVQTLAGLGARNILVLNLPDISKTARFTTGSGAPAASLIQQASLTFNNELRARLDVLSLPGGTAVTLFDLGSVFSGILANASRFGFSVTNQEYLGILLAGGSPGDVNNYVFWDGIHPTTKTHAILAGALTEVLNPEFVLGTAGVQGTAALAAADVTADAINERLDHLRHAEARNPTEAFVTYSLKDGSFDFRTYQNGFDYELRQFTAGFDHQLCDTLTVGLAFGQEVVEATLKAGAGSFKLEGVSGVAFAQWQSGMLFAEATAGYGGQDVTSIKRTTAFGAMQAGATTSGNRQLASIRAGANLGGANLQFSPYVGLRYTRVDLQGYTESGVPGLNFRHNDQEAEAHWGLAGIAIRWQATANLAAEFSALAQFDLRDGNRELSGRLDNTVAPVARVSVQDGLDDSIKFGGRVVGLVGKGWNWGVGYQADVRDDGDTGSRFMVTLGTGF